MGTSPQEVVEWIGEQYVETYQSLPNNRVVRDAFHRMADRNDEMFREIPVPVHFQADDPYSDFADMRETVDDEDRLLVFSGGDPHPIWDHHAEVTARAVHDWYGHLALDVDFSPTGEYRKWEHARNHYPAYCDRVFFTEVVGQLGAVYYLDDGFADDRFEQKVFPAPVDWIEEMARAVEAETRE